MNRLKTFAWSLLVLLLAGTPLWASEADLAIPDLKEGTFFGGAITAWDLLFYGSFVIAGTLGISLYLRAQIYKQPAHQSMLGVAEIIYQTCKTYLIQQGKFLLMLFVFIAIAISFYLLVYGHEPRYQVTNANHAELAKKGVPAEVLAALEPLKDKKGLDKKKFLDRITEKVATRLSAPTYEKLLQAGEDPKGSGLTGEPKARHEEAQREGREHLKEAARKQSEVQARSLVESLQNTLLTGTLVPHAVSSGMTVLLVLLFAVVGMGGSYWVAWYGIRVNTYANARTAFASLRGRPWDVVNIPLRAGMSIGLFLISLELIMMVFILLAGGTLMPREVVGVCFLGFAIGESLGASALRIAGGIFTKIADIGSDLMKIVFNVKEDDPRNPGVIADCTGDNAGDSVGPTADGFETYGVTGVALISFIVLSITDVTVRNYLDIQAKLIVWIFAMRFLMDFMSGVSYFVNQAISEKKYGHLKEFDFEQPLTRLIWIASILCITTSFGMSYLLIGDLSIEKVTGESIEKVVLSDLWWQLAGIISCGTLAAVLIPEFTKIFTSSHSKHVNEIVTASREGGASLTILSGLVAGNFSAFWKGILIAGLMAVAYFISLISLHHIMGAYGSIFAFGLVAFGFLCMGPVNIAVDSYGPVTDNAQSIFELAQTQHLPGIKEEIKRDFGFEPNFEEGKHFLEANDAAGNTFKATAKPVLIGTAVVGATTMIFAIVLMLKDAGMLALDLTQAPVLLGFICGGAVVYWFCGASMQAVTTGAYRAVEFIKKNMDLTKKVADIEDSKTVVRICTEYAQAGMWNIFIALMTITLAFAFFDPNFFVAYLISIAVFGLFQAIFMANAGGAWDNAKKLVEVDLKERNTPLHEATVVGDTVGDPFKDTTSVSLNPIIKFSTLFGLLAVEIAIGVKTAARLGEGTDYTGFLGLILFGIALIFVWRSFYAMRIPPKETTAREGAH